MRFGLRQLGLLLLFTSGLTAAVAGAATSKTHGVRKPGGVPARHSASAHGKAAHGTTSRRGSVTARHTGVREAGSHGRVRLVRGRLVGRVPVRYGERFYASSFANDNTIGDVSAGEDPVVRQAAIQALGNMNGTALAIDPSTGRILAMVNQRLALSAGAEPCSTIKVAVALAALKEGVITESTPVNLGGHYTLDLTHALAKSVNLYFEVLGRAMGFDRVKYYANQFGLGELAGYNIPGEHLGVYPDTELPQASGGVGRMCSFGESISMTPLQLGALVGAIANGGTLYYLQHPTSQAQVAALQPQVKRQLDIANVIPQILPGMQGAVNFSNGTARSLRANFVQFPGLRQNGHMLQQRNALRLVCVLCGHPKRSHRDGHLPRRRPSNLRPESCRTDRNLLPRDV